MTGTRENEAEAPASAPKCSADTAGNASTVAQDLAWVATERHGRALRRAWGGRLRTYRPTPGGESRFAAIRKALVRGELVLNGFNRWRLLPAIGSATGWTFTEAGRTAEVADIETRIARREAHPLHVLGVDEVTAEETVKRLEVDGQRPDLVIARRDWVRRPDPCPAFDRLVIAARTRGLVVHVIAALGIASPRKDDLHQEAQRRWRLDREPLLRPLPNTSNVERRFGDMLAAAGLAPVPQHPVAHFFMDFAVTGHAAGLPVRLDVEVDGRLWHEELPGWRRPRDERRDRILMRLGWRPIRLWADEIQQDEAACIELIRREAASPAPLARRNHTLEERP